MVTLLSTSTAYCVHGHIFFQISYLKKIISEKKNFFCIAVHVVYCYEIVTKIFNKKKIFFSELNIEYFA